MHRIPVTSSQIASIGYDPSTQTLEIEFKGHNGNANTVYQYDKFPPDQWETFRGAPSTGSHFYKHIKGKFGYRKTH